LRAHLGNSRTHQATPYDSYFLNRHAFLVRNDRNCLAEHQSEEKSTRDALLTWRLVHRLDNHCNSLPASNAGGG